MPEPNYLVYAHPGAPPPQPRLGGSYRWELWRPGLLRLRPPGSGRAPWAWWLFHYARVFANRDYAALLLWQDRRLAHRSLIFPGYFRFPFQARQDLQIGDTWTDPADRGQGLATFALRHIVTVCSLPGKRRFWYIVEENNPASIRVVEKAGFQLVGRGQRTSRWGIRLLGAYRLDAPPHGASARGPLP